MKRRLLARALDAGAAVLFVIGFWCAWNGHPLVALGLYLLFGGALELGAAARNRGPR